MIYPQNFEQKIGFDEIRTILGGHCLSPLGRERVEQMRFLTDIAPLRELQEHTREFLRIMDSGQDFPEQDFYDVRPAIRRIRIEGTYLDETELFDLKRSLTTIIDIISFLDKVDRHPADLKTDYCGFDIPDEFVVGYGLDYANYYRNLPYIGILKPEVYAD